MYKHKELTMKPIIAPLKFDFCLNPNGDLHVIDIGDGFACGISGFDKIEQKIITQANDQGIQYQPALDGEIPGNLLLDEHENLPVTFYGYSDNEKAVWPLSDANRYIAVKLVELAVENKIANGYSSTLYGVEMHKILLYLLRAKYLEGTTENTFAFWHSDIAIDDVLDEINQRNIEHKDGLFLKKVNRSTGGSDQDEVMYFNDMNTLRAKLTSLSHAKDSGIYVIEQAYTYTKTVKSSSSYVVAGRAFGILNYSPDQGVAISIIDAKYMLPPEQYKGFGLGTRNQFVARTESSNILIELTPSEKGKLTQQINQKYQAVFQGLCQDEKTLKREFTGRLLEHYRQLGRVMASNSAYQLIAKIEHGMKSLIPQVTVGTLNSIIIRDLANCANSIADCELCVRVLSNISEYNSAFKKSIWGSLTSLSLHRAIAHMTDYLDPINIQKVNKLFKQSIDIYLSFPLPPDSMQIWSSYPSDYNQSIMKIRGKSPSYDSADKYIALQQAAIVSDKQTLIILLLGRVVHIDALNKTGHNALHVALKAKQTPKSNASIRLLIEACKEKIANWKYVRQDAITLSKVDDHYAEIQRLFFFQQLLQDIDNIEALDDKLSAMIHEQGLTNEACESMITLQVRAYLQAKNSQYDKQDFNRALRQAVSQSDVQTASLLMHTRLADPFNLSPSGKTALAHAETKKGAIKRLVKDYCSYHQQTSLGATSHSRAEQSAAAEQSLFNRTDAEPTTAKSHRL